MIAGSQPLVSIVTPVHNEAAYLAECIESVRTQTYRHWDYTIVDNSSSDGTTEIARRYAAIDARIRVCESQRFRDVLANHNFALRQISPLSKYCKVVFADDLIFPECLERMVAVAEEEPSVGLVGAYVLEDRTVTCTGLPHSIRRIHGRDICRQHLLDRLYVWGSANSLLYRADLVRTRDPFFNEGNIHADTEACFSLLRTSDFGFVHQVLTFTRVRPQSLTAMSTDRGTYFGGMLRILVTHGPDYLTRQELEILMEQHLAGYYRYLAQNLFLKRDEDFWRYHRRQLIDTGLGFSRTRLTRAALATLWSAALHPRKAVDKLMKVRQRWIANAPGSRER
jgi:glycosyltransferase involved in cell wall biosynthesis